MTTHELVHQNRTTDFVVMTPTLRPGRAEQSSTDREMGALEFAGPPDATTRPENNAIRHRPCRNYEWAGGRHIKWNLTDR
jgi:hypothetical protein